MNFVIRQETLVDHNAVYEVIKAAFKSMSESDQSEHLLVERLRRSESFIPELSLVAENENRIVGHILFTKIKIVGNKQEHDSLALAPVSVHPGFQGNGIGSDLIREGHKNATTMGHHSVILLGHPEYYPRFGYVRASNFGIDLPFGSPDPTCMAIELEEGALVGKAGLVEYPKEFFE